jgi:hypothetical protein
MLDQAAARVKRSPPVGCHALRSFVTEKCVFAFERPLSASQTSPESSKTCCGFSKRLRR